MGPPDLNGAEKCAHRAEKRRFGLYQSALLPLPGTKVPGSSPPQGWHRMWAATKENVACVENVTRAAMDVEGANRLLTAKVSLLQPDWF